MAYTKKQKLEMLRSQLENEKASFKSHWRECNDYILPRRARFFVSDVNRGDRRNNFIIDNTATLAARTLRSGMMSGITSPARPWFRLTTPDPDLAEFGEVKRWLDAVSQRMNTSFLRSNLYNVLPIIYGDIGVFGIGAMYIEEDFDGNVMRFYPFPIGSYSISQNEKLQVDTFYREFRMTVRQLVEKFGKKDKNNKNIDWSNFSMHVKSLYDQQLYETWIDVVHVIKPNQDYDPKKLESKYKKYLSCYYERGMIGDSAVSSTDYSQDIYLEESGYDYFPVLCPRWETTGEDTYATSCPGMDSLGDIKQLQVVEKRVLEAIDKKIKPPLTGSTSLKNTNVSILPGDITYEDVQSTGQGLRAVYQVNFDIREAEEKQEQVRQRIRRAFFEDLFMMLANTDRRQITAREIDERHEEKLLALGPVLEQLNQDLLDPLIDIAFAIHLKQGLIPPPPEQLQGMDLKVEYLSIMAQAQKLVGVGSLERFTGYVSGLAQVDPTVLDKMNFDQNIDVYADMISAPPSIVRTDEEVAEIRGARSAQQQQQQQLANLQAGAKVAKDLGQADLSEDAALGAIAKQVTGGI